MNNVGWWQTRNTWNILCDKIALLLLYDDNFVNMKRHTKISFNFFSWSFFSSDVSLPIEFFGLSPTLFSTVDSKRWRSQLMRKVQKTMKNLSTWKINSREISGCTWTGRKFSQRSTSTRFYNWADPSDSDCSATATTTEFGRIFISIFHHEITLICYRCPSSRKGMKWNVLIWIRGFQFKYAKFYFFKRSLNNFQRKLKRNSLYFHHIPCLNQ